MADQATRKIVLLNVRAEYPPEIALNAAHPIVRACWRTAWYAEAGDVIASPVPFDEDFLQHVGGSLGFDADTISVIVRDHLLTDDVILAPDFVDELREAISGHPKWRIMTCFATDGIAELADLLDVEFEGIEFAAERGGDLLNRKSHFRQLAAGTGLPLAAGAVVRSPERLTRAIEKYLPDTGAVIVKQDNGGGGLGNIILAADDIGPLPGAREVRKIGDNVSAVSEQLWDDLFQDQHPGLVVEVYHSETRHMFYLEYIIDVSGVAQFLNSARFKLVRAGTPAEPRLSWVGLELPANVPPHSFAHAVTHATRFTTLLAAIGYRGYLNIDLIVTSSGDLIFNEVNGRWAGGTVLHTVASRLLGENYADHCVASSVRDIRPMELQTALSVIRKNSLEFTAERKDGVVVLSCDPAKKENSEFLLIGDSTQRVRELETTFRAAVESA